MLRALRYALRLTYAVLVAQAALVLLALAGPVLQEQGIGGVNFTSDARFLSAAMSALVAPIAFFALVLGLIGTRVVSADDRPRAWRTVRVGAGALVATTVWLNLSAGVFGGGIIPH